VLLIPQIVSMVKYVFITTTNVFFLVAALNLMGFRVNTTASYPEGIYRLVSNEWKRNDLVEVCLPVKIRDMAIERGYLKDQGRCGGHPPVIKRVVGLGGDQVEISNVVSINGEVSNNSKVRTLDSNGRALNSAKNETVADGHVWLMSTFNDKSFDSRYFGSIEEHYVVGQLEALWTY